MLNLSDVLLVSLFGLPEFILKTLDLLLLLNGFLTHAFFKLLLRHLHALEVAIALVGNAALQLLLLPLVELLQLGQR